MTLKAIIMDNDGTFVENAMPEAVAVVRALAGHGIVIDEMVFARRFASIKSSTIYAELFGEVGKEVPTDFEKITEHDILKETMASPDLAMPGIRDAAQSWAAQGLQLAIASGATLIWLHTIHDHLGTRDMFGEHIYSATQVENGKPAPDLLLLAASRLGLLPEECAYVGDGLPDIVAAKAANMTAIGLLRGAHCRGNTVLRERMEKAGADFIVDDVAELQAVVDLIRHGPNNPKSNAKMAPAYR